VAASLNDIQINRIENLPLAKGFKIVSTPELESDSNLEIVDVPYLCLREG
jgi:hypothetical protein